MKSRRSKACDITDKVKAEVWERDNHKCIICGDPSASPNAHYISRAKGGLGILENIVTLCIRCHHTYDNGTKDQRELYKQRIRGYLRIRYPLWSEENLIYNKWR